MPWLPAVEIAPDPVNGDQPCDGVGANIFPNQITPPVFFGGNIYILLAPRNTNFPCEFYRSSDDGQTWSGPLDAAHAPGFNNGVPVFDGAHTVLVVYSTEVTVLAPVRITKFDLTTETWGANAGDTAGNYDTALAAFLRSDGSIVAVLASASNLRSAAIWSAGTWTSEFDISTNFPAGWQADATSAVLDSGDRLHVFMRVYTLGTGSMLYQQVAAGGVLGPFFDFGSGSSGEWFAAECTMPCIFQNQIVLPAMDPVTFRMSFFTGAPLANPVFVFSAVFADPDAAFQAQGGLYSATTDGTTCYISYSDSFSYALIRCCQSTDLVTWFGSTPALDVIGNHQLFPMALPNLVAGEVPVTFSEPDPVSFAGARFFVPWGGAAPLAASCNAPPDGTVGVAYTHSFTASGGTAPYTFTISAGTLPGGLTLASDGSVTGAPLLAGTFAFSVQVTDAAAAISIVACSITIHAHGPAVVAGGSPGGGGPGGGSGAAGGASGSGGPGSGGAYRPPMCERCCPPSLAELVPWKRPKRLLEMDAPPRGSKHVAAGTSIPAPATNVQTLIVQYQVPNGFRFKLAGLLLGCNCPGWTPGDGNAVFSVTLNKPLGSVAAQGTPLRGLGSVSVPLGSFAYGPWPVLDGEQPVFESRDILRVLVTSNPLVIAPGLPNVFTAMLVGHTWPLTSQNERAML